MMLQIDTMLAVSGLLTVTAALAQAAVGIGTAFARNKREVLFDKSRIERFDALAAAVREREQTDRERNVLSWTGKRKFRIRQRVYENPNFDICSFYLVPHDQGFLPSFRPGQFLRFEATVPGETLPISGIYSLSDSPTKDAHYRVSVKKMGPPADAPEGTPPGRCSNYFHDSLKEGDTIDVYAPSGPFFIDDESERPVVLIAGGVGLTPLVSMITWLVDTESHREVWFFYGVRNRGEHAMYEMLRKLADEHSNIHLVVAYSRPSENCTKGTDYDAEGRITTDLIRSYIDPIKYEFYMCGLPAMTKKIAADLKALGVEDGHISFEAFLPPPPPKKKKSVDGDTISFQIEFKKSKKTLTWTEGDGFLWQFAKENGITIAKGCMSGIDRFCETTILSGEVEYPETKPKDRDPSGSFLPCIATPKTDLVLDC